MSLAVLQSELAQAAGETCVIHARSSVPLDDIPSEQDLLAIASRSEISEQRRADLLADMAIHSANMVDADSTPTITPQLLYQHTNDGGDYYGIGFSMPLYFWNPNKGNVIRADARQKANETNRAFLNGGGFATKIRQLRRAAQSAQERAELYSARVVPAFAAALKGQERLYLEGRGNVVQVWQTLRTFNEAQQNNLRILLEDTTARVQLAILIGEEV